MAKRPPHSILDTAVRLLVEADKDPVKLPFIILQSNAKLPFAFFQRINPQIAIADFDAGSTNQNHNAALETWRGIFLQPYSVEPGTFASIIFHEVSHYADSLLLDQWVRANLDLLKNGHNADQQFQKYFRIRDGRYEIDRGYWTVFTETRAYLAQLMAYKTVAPVQNHRALEDLIMNEMLRQFSAEEFRFAKTFTVDHRLKGKDLLMFGDLEGQKMRVTIDQPLTCSQIFRIF